MLKKTITYTDFNGEKRTEDFYFNLSKAELTEMQLSVNGGMTEYLNKIVNSQDNVEIFNTFKTIMFKAIGEKSVDGKRFIKNQDIRDSFEQSEAYSELLITLLQNPDEAAKFIDALIPQDIKQPVEKLEVVSEENNKNND